MSRFHIGDSGRVSPCAATKRPCPLGPHYESQEAAAWSLLAPDERRPEPAMPFGKYEGKPLDVVAQDRAYLAWLIHKSDLNRTDPQLHRRLRELDRIGRLRKDFGSL